MSGNGSSKKLTVGMTVVSGLTGFAGGCVTDHPKIAGIAIVSVVILGLALIAAQWSIDYKYPIIRAGGGTEAAKPDEEAL